MPPREAIAIKQRTLQSGEDLLRAIPEASARLGRALDERSALKLLKAKQDQEQLIRVAETNLKYEELQEKRRSKERIAQVAQGLAEPQTADEFLVAGRAVDLRRKQEEDAVDRLASDVIGGFVPTEMVPPELAPKVGEKVAKFQKEAKATEFRQSVIEAYDPGNPGSFLKKAVTLNPPPGEEGFLQNRIRLAERAKKEAEEAEFKEKFSEAMEDFTGSLSELPAHLKEKGVSLSLDEMATIERLSLAREKEEGIKERTAQASEIAQSRLRLSLDAYELSKQRLALAQTEAERAAAERKLDNDRADLSQKIGIIKEMVGNPNVDPAGKRELRALLLEIGEPE